MTETVRNRLDLDRLQFALENAGPKRAVERLDAACEGDREDKSRAKPADTDPR